MCQVGKPATGTGKGTTLMSTKPHGAAPVLHVSDVEKSLDYYRNALGFEESFRYGTTYAGVQHGSVSLHLAIGGGEYNRPIGASNVYFFLDSPAAVDAYYAEVVARGAKTDKEPQDYPYAMRDFAVFDPDGNILTFGADTEGGK
jgi:catechol 2,3-dioxygenase-like lactoylglutathione lyase family enzyme